MALNAKQQRFVDEYLIDLNASAAARRAGYSQRTAGKQGHDLLQKPEIKAAIEQAKAKRAERTRVTQDKVIRELAKLGFSDMRELAAWGSHGLTWTDSTELEDEAAACVQEVNFTVERRYDRNGDLIETSNMKLKTHDKKSALKMLGDHLGIFEQSNTEVGKLADSFLAGVNTVKEMAVKDMSE